LKRLERQGGGREASWTASGRWGRLRKCEEGARVRILTKRLGWLGAAWETGQSIVEAHGSRALS